MGERRKMSGYDDDSLKPWSSISDSFNRASLLLGNGASQVIWPKFGYCSLYDQARCSVSNPLTLEDENLFQKFNTRNFELILEKLISARSVMELMPESGVYLDRIQQHYKRVQDALIEAVRNVHVPRSKVDDMTILEHLCLELKKYRCIYTTNYDLLLYWIMSRDWSAYTDYFSSPSGTNASDLVFDITTRRSVSPARPVLYIHGALHLYRSKSRLTYKLRWNSDGNILDRFGKYPEPDAVPLFVSEGTSKDKISAIDQSGYLSFAYGHFALNRDKLVIFGQSLSESDMHIVAPIKEQYGREVAISIYRRADAKQGDVKSEKARYTKLLPNQCLSFFDAATHPLGAKSLAV
jgi:hypothetical protein